MGERFEIHPGDMIRLKVPARSLWGESPECHVIVGEEARKTGMFTVRNIYDGCFDTEEIRGDNWNGTKDYHWCIDIDDIAEVITDTSDISNNDIQPLRAFIGF